MTSDPSCVCSGLRSCRGQGVRGGATEGLSYLAWWPARGGRLLGAWGARSSGITASGSLSLFHSLLLLFPSRGATHAGCGNEWGRDGKRLLCTSRRCTSSKESICVRCMSASIVSRYCFTGLSLTSPLAPCREHGPASESRYAFSLGDLSASRNVGQGGTRRHWLRTV